MLRIHRIVPAASVMLVGMTGVPMRSFMTRRSDRQVVPCDSTIVAPTRAAGAHAITVIACDGNATAAGALARQQAVGLAAHALQVYGQLTGVPYPAPRYEMHFLAGAATGGGGGLAGPHGAAFDVPLPDAETAPDRPALLAKILVHEVAHQWRWRGPQIGSWLAEGFADFMAGQVAREQGGARAEEELLFFYNAAWDPQYDDDPAVPDRFGGSTFPYGWFSLPWPGAVLWTQPLDHEQAYYRGALVLWMLEQQLGEARFWAAMHTFLTVPPATSDPSDAFLQAIRSVSGEDLGWFFREWVHGTGYPRFTVAASYEATSQRVTLTVRQAAPVFRMPVTLRVGTAHGDVVTQTTVDAATQTLVVAHVTTPPTFVVFDDGDAIVKTLDFPQPTPWLATALRRETRPWQTWWTIDQLRQRASQEATQEATARTALLWTARHGRFALTRAQALMALSAVGPHTPPSVLAALQAADADTSVLVRRAAVQGLAAVGTPAAERALLDISAHDASPLVRATALFRGLGTAPRDTQRARFVQALQAPPSYADIVPLAATWRMALAGQCDSATMATLRTATRDPQVAATLQRVATVVTSALANQTPAPDPTCVQTFLSLFP